MSGNLNSSSREPIWKPKIWDVRGGKLFCRPIGENMALGGILHLDESALNEGRAYVLSLFNGCGHIIELPDEQQFWLQEEDIGSNIDNHLRAKRWAKLADSNSAMVRFISGNANKGEWVVYGVGYRTLTGPRLANDSWFDFVGGSIGSAIQLSDQQFQVETRGNTMSQILGEPVWPGRDGQLYALPSLRTQDQQLWAKHSNLLADVGDGSVSVEDYYAIARVDPALSRCMFMRIDEEYAAALSRIRKLNGSLHSYGMRTREDWEKNKDDWRNVMRGQRMKPSI